MLIPVDSSLIYTTNKPLVQRKLLSFAGFKSNIVQPPHDCAPVLHNLNLLSLADRRIPCDLTFRISNVLKYIVFYSLLQNISSRVPAHPTRNITYTRSFNVDCFSVSIGINHGGGQLERIKSTLKVTNKVLVPPWLCSKYKIFKKIHNRKMYFHNQGQSYI